MAVTGGFWEGNEMPRLALSALEGRDFDVAVIGAGAIGAGAAHHLAAAGYGVLIVDKGDFGGGSSSRSSRLLHCGLRYLEPGEGLAYRNPTMWDPVLHPRRYLHNLGRARGAIAARHEIATTMPERVRDFTFCLVNYEGGPYRPWHVGAGLKLLSALGPRGGLPLEGRRLSRREAAEVPLLRLLREPDRVSSTHTFREFQYEWAERIVMDSVLDAERMGAAARNYTPVTGLAREGRDWRITLGDALEAAAVATVRAKWVLNTTGMWTDRVNRLGSDRAGRKVRGTKGTHIMFRLPPGCEGHGLGIHTGDPGPFYLLPWRGMHYVGPTDTPHDGDEDDVRPTETEIEQLLAEVGHWLPAAGIGREDVLYAWAGVRPLTYDPVESMGLRDPTFHDLAADGLPGAFAQTSTPIMYYRQVGRALCRAVAARVAPSGPRQDISYAAKTAPADEVSPALLNHWAGATLADLRHAAEHEQPASLADLLFRRVGAGWTETMAREGARKAAETVADILGWDEARIDAEVAAYHAYLARHHRIGADIGP